MISRQATSLVLVLGLCAGTVFAAVPITVENYSFELPGTVKTQIDQSGSVPGWTKVDLNTEAGVEMPANDPQPLYVAVEGGGIEKTVEHPDNPNAALSNDWQRWDIPLNVFSDAGVNLSTVQKIIIGVGSKTAGQQDGAGTLYIDDIRLYKPTPPEAE
jgi:hypothetical protein